MVQLHGRVSEDVTSHDRRDSRHQVRGQRVLQHVTESSRGLRGFDKIRVLVHRQKYDSCGETKLLQTQGSFDSVYHGHGDVQD